MVSIELFALDDLPVNLGGIINTASHHEREKYNASALERN